MIIRCFENYKNHHSLCFKKSETAKLVKEKTRNLTIIKRSLIDVIKNWSSTAPFKSASAPGGTS